jgi:hypothetical protein
MTSVPDWLAVVGILVPAVAGLGGYYLAGRNEEERDLRTAEREETSRRRAFVERLEERRRGFQLDLLLELQDVLQKEVRATSKNLMHDLRTLRNSGTLTQLGLELSDESYEIGVAMNRLRVRVLDDDLRADLASFHEYVSSVEVSLILVKDE